MKVVGFRLSAAERAAGEAVADGMGVRLGELARRAYLAAVAAADAKPGGRGAFEGVLTPAGMVSTPRNGRELRVEYDRED